MKIRSIHIVEFGCLKQRDFALGEGLNLFEGHNESGKSTILAFIRFVLFGLPRRAAGEILSERERGLSWDSGTAEGYLDIEVDGHLYRVYRRGQAGGTAARETYNETVTVTDLESGLEAFHGEVPGKVFLGMTPEVFTSTSCVRQLDCTRVSGEDVRSSIENLLFSADESINVQKALEKLDDLRRGLLYKNGKGGKLFDLDVEKMALQTRLDTACENAKSIIEKELLLDKARELSQKHQKEIEHYEELLGVYEACVTLGRFEALHKEEKKRKEISDELGRLAQEQGFGGILPDRETTARLEKAERDLQNTDFALQSARGALAIAEQSPRGDQTLASAQADVEKAGGKESVLSAFRRLRKKKTADTVLSVLGFLFGILLAGAGALFLVDTPLSFLADYLPFGPYPYLGAGGALLILGLVLSILGGKNGKRIRALLSSIRFGGRRASETTLGAYLDDCRKNGEQSLRYDKAMADAREMLLLRREEAKSASNEALQLLSQLHREPDADDVATLSVALRKTAEESAALCNQKETLSCRADACDEQIRVTRAALEGINEATLRAQLGSHDPAELLAEINPDKTKSLYNYARVQKDATEQRRLALEKDLVALDATSENPARLSGKLEACEKKYEEAKLEHDALVAASQTLGEAVDKLHESVAPALRLRAGELMARMTDGKYKSFGISGDMKISILSDTGSKPVDAYSKGTIDAAYISLRMALVDLISADNPPPLCFDESFTQMDEDRTAAMLRMLENYCQNGNQCLVFTCHKREGEILSALGDYSKIIL